MIRTERYFRTVNLRDEEFSVFGIVWKVLFFLILFSSIPSCHFHPRKQDKQTQQWMTKFFYDLLFIEGGAYTVWGTKPITEIALYHFSDSDIASMEATHSSDEVCYAQEDYDLPENWKKWEREASRFPMKNYHLFLSHRSPDQKISYL